MRKNIDRTYRDKKILERLYVDEGKSIIMISKIFEISNSLVLHHLRKHGIKTRIRGDYNSAVEFFKDKKFLVEKYVLKAMSLPEIAKEMNCSDDCVLNWLKKHNIPRRTKKEALTGKPKPAYMIPIFRERAKKQKGSKNGNWKGGVTSKHHSFRTSGDYLIFQKAIWERDNYTCVLCFSWKKPQVHHIFPLWHSWDKRLDLNNGITLCKKCHESIRGKELQYSNHFLMVLKNRVNSGKPLCMGNPEPSFMRGEIRGELKKVQRLPEDGTPSLITGKNARMLTVFKLIVGILNKRKNIFNFFFIKQIEIKTSMVGRTKRNKIPRSCWAFFRNRNNMSPFTNSIFSANKTKFCSMFLSPCSQVLSILVSIFTYPFFSTRFNRGWVSFIPFSLIRINLFSMCKFVRFLPKIILGFLIACFTKTYCFMGNIISFARITFFKIMLFRPHNLFYQIFKKMSIYEIVHTSSKDEMVRTISNV